MASERPDTFATAFLQDHLFDAVLTSWIFLAFYYRNGFLELYSPRGTDDLVMATGNALICWAFGAFVLG